MIDASKMTSIEMRALADNAIKRAQIRRGITKRPNAEKDRLADQLEALARCVYILLGIIEELEKDEEL